MNKRYIMLIVIFILCIILGVTLYCSFSDNNKNKNNHKSTTEKLFQTADECAEEGQDIFNEILGEVEEFLAKFNVVNQSYEEEVNCE